MEERERGRRHYSFSVSLRCDAIIRDRTEQVQLFPIKIQHARNEQTRLQISEGQKLSGSVKNLPGLAERHGNSEPKKMNLIYNFSQIEHILS